MNKIQIIYSFTLQKSGCTTHSLLVAKLKFMEDFEGLREPIKFRPAPRPAPLFKPTPLIALHGLSSASILCSEIFNLKVFKRII